MSYLVGIDGGGTGCRAAIAEESGRIVGRGRSGAANIRTDLDGARANIMAAVTEAAASAGLSAADIKDAVAVLGLAGGNVGNYAKRLRALLPFRLSAIVNDGLIALYGALGPHDGMVGIVGTGTVFLARHGNAIRSIGGWGFQVSDLGSGARLGRQLLEETLLAHDGVRPASAVTAKVMALFDGRPDKLVARVREAAPAYYGSFAPMLVEAGDSGDPVAEAILAEGCRDIERMLAAIIAPETGRLCLLGGLAGMYEGRLSAPYRAILRPPLNDALNGALTMAAVHAEDAARQAVG